MTAASDAVHAPIAFPCFVCALSGSRNRLRLG
jgi:hypothetical protein